MVDLAFDGLRMLAELAVCLALVVAPLDVEQERKSARQQLEVGEPEKAVEALQTLYLRLPAEDLATRAEVAVELADARIALFGLDGDASQLARARTSLTMLLGSMSESDLRRPGIEAKIAEIESLQRKSGEGSEAPASDRQPKPGWDAPAPATEPTGSQPPVGGTAQGPTTSPPPPTMSVAERNKLVRDRDRYRRRSKSSFGTGAVFISVGAGVMMPLAIWSTLRLSRANSAYTSFGCSTSDSSSCDAIERDKRVFLPLTISTWILGIGLTAAGATSLANGGKYKRRARALDDRLQAKASLRPWLGVRSIGVSGRF
ncbi:MAG: hypothetical protein D6705_09490 [Deltaproteobacteria bacterium]|nr:MAG: hypothetical protein D6705_09490 [Deltaproteobacteria bacterium]